MYKKQNYKTVNNCYYVLMYKVHMEVANARTQHV